MVTDIRDLNTIFDDQRELVPAATGQRKSYGGLFKGILGE